MSTPNKIVAVRFVSGVMGPTPVEATLDDGTTQHLFSYYADEISFQADEFVGLTPAQARTLFCDRDRAYLQSASHVIGSPIDRQPKHQKS